MTRHVDFSRLERDWGIVTIAQDWLKPEWRRDINVAMDAQPALVTTPSSGIPAFLTTALDPQVVRVLQAPNEGANIYGEEKKGDWKSTTAMFLVVENVGEVSSYDDYNENGYSNVNTTFPQRQSYHFQTFIEYGDREVDIMDLTALNWVAEKQISGAKTLDKFMNYTYHFGVAGLQNYGMLNDPSLSAALTPSVKAAGGTKWVNNGVIVATANEVILDIQSLYNQLVAQTQGLVKRNSAMTLILPPQADVGFLAINTYANDVETFMKRGFPNMKMETSPLYATAAGNVVQLKADEFDGNKTGVCAFTEKQRDHRVIPQSSSFRQKKTSGSWGWIGKYPQAVAQMIGV